MSLVEQSCKVRVAETKWGPAIFFHWDESHMFMAQGQPSDDELRETYHLHDIAVECGKPATNYVDYGEDRVWMCDEHYGMAVI